MCEHKSFKSFKSFIRLGHFLPAPCGQHLELGQKQTGDSFCVGATSCHFKFEHSFQVFLSSCSNFLVELYWKWKGRLRRPLGALPQRSFSSAFLVCRVRLMLLLCLPGTSRMPTFQEISCFKSALQYTKARRNYVEQVSLECWFVHSPDWRSSATLGHCRPGTKRSLSLVALVEFHHDTTWHLWISLVASMALDTLKELHSMEKVCAKRAVDKIWSIFVST